MSRRFIQEEITPINPSIQGILNRAMRNRRPHQTSVIGVDPANPQGQTAGNSIIAGPSAPADPAEVSRSPSTSSTSVIENIVIFGLLMVAGFVGVVSGIIYTLWKAIPGNSRTSAIRVDLVNPQGQTPQGQTPGNSIIAGPSAPADSAQVSSSPSTSSSTSVTVFAIFVILGVLFVREPKIIFQAMVIIFETKIIVAGFVGVVSGIIQTFWKASPGDSRTSVTVFAIFMILGVLFVREPKIIFKAMVIIIETMMMGNLFFLKLAGFVKAVCKIIQTFWNASPGGSRTSVIGVDPANPQGQTPGNSIIAGPSAPADPSQVSSSPSTASTSVIGVDPANPQGQMPGNSIIAGPSAPADPVQVSSTPTSSTSAQALPQAGGRSRISSSVSIGQDQAFDEAGAAPIK